METGKESSRYSESMLKIRSSDGMHDSLISHEANGLPSAAPEVAPLSNLSAALEEDDARGWRELASEGYTIKPFLGPVEIEALNQLRLATIPDVPSGFYISVFSTPETRRAILEGFRTILKDKIKTLAPGFSLVHASFVIKKARSENGRLELHQDSSLVDHSKDLGMNVWVPLCDVDSHNGCLRVAGRSHRFNLIGSLPPLYGPHSEFERDLVAPAITSLCMKAGDACMFDTRLLHASENNLSDSCRVAAFFSLVPEGRPFRMYFRNPETPNQLDVFQVDSEFMLHLDPLHYPDAADREKITFLESFQHVPRKLSAADFAALHQDVGVPADSPPLVEEVVPPFAPSPVAAMGGPSAKTVPISSLWTRLWHRFRQ